VPLAAFFETEADEGLIYFLLSLDILRKLYMSVVDCSKDNK
jgi:hypothetical protein